MQITTLPGKARLQSLIPSEPTRSRPSDSAWIRLWLLAPQPALDRPGLEVRSTTQGFGSVDDARGDENDQLAAEIATATSLE